MRALFYLSSVVLLAAGGFLAYLWATDSHRTTGEPVAPGAAVVSNEAPTSPSPPAPGGQPGNPEPAEPAESEAPVLTSSEAPDTGEIVEQGIEAFNAGEYETAIGLLKGLPEDRRALMGVGLSYYKLGEYRQAIGFLEDSLQMGGEEFVALKFLSLAYYKMDELEKSMLNAGRALALREDTELEGFYQRLSAEKKALSHRVDEETLHFKVVFDGYRHGGISRTVLGILEEAYREIGGRFGHFPEQPVTVVLYTEKEFFDVTMLPAFTAGAFDGKIRLPVKGLEEGGREAMRHVLFHEYVHALVHSIARNVPLWMNEGLAEYLVPRGFEKTGQALPLKALGSAFPLNDQGLTTMAYAESYSAVSHLAGHYGLYSIKELLFALGRGEGLDEAFSASFYVTYDEFVSTWGRE